MKELIILLFQSQVFAHMKHLTIRNYAVHMALQPYYEDVTGLLDDLAELWLSKEDFVLPSSISIPDVEPLSYFEALTKKLQDMATSMNTEALKGKLADIQELVDKTIYKLKLDGDVE